MTDDSLPPAIAKSITAADGYVDLRMPDHAERELESVPESFRNLLPYRWVDCRLLMLREQWEEARCLVAGICEDEPQEAGSWVTLAYTTRRSIGIEEARDILLQVLPRFPEDGIFPYNLACYACRLSDLELARNYLKAAFNLGAMYRDLAAKDEDLKELWPELPTLGAGNGSTE